MLLILKDCELKSCLLCCFNWSMSEVSEINTSTSTSWVAGSRTVETFILKMEPVFSNLKREISP